MVLPINTQYQNNPNWALDNKLRGKRAAICEGISLACAALKAFTDDDSKANEVFDFSQKCLDAGRNYEQYSLYIRDDDDVGKDKKEKPFCGKVGHCASFIEKNINWWLRPLSFLCGKKIQEGYCLISNYLNSIWWRLRLCFEKINWKTFKILPTRIKELFSGKANEMQEACEDIKNLVMPFLGWIGVVSIGIFTPIKSGLKFKEHDNKLVNSLASLGFASQNIYYFFKFTLPEYFDIKSKRSNNSKLLFSLGLVSNITNALLPLLELIPHDKSRNLLTETAQGLNRLFFSIRRNILGNNWLEKNPI